SRGGLLPKCLAPALELELNTAEPSEQSPLGHAEPLGDLREFEPLEPEGEKLDLVRRPQMAHEPRKHLEEALRLAWGGLARQGFPRLAGEATGGTALAVPCPDIRDIRAAVSQRQDYEPAPEAQPVFQVEAAQAEAAPHRLRRLRGVVPLQVAARQGTQPQGEA